MSLLIGTRDGLFRASGVEFDSTEQLLDDGLSSAYRFESTSDLFALSGGELHRSTDRGDSWNALDTPQETVTAVLAGPGGKRLYIGTYPPAQVYVSTDSGESWEELDDFPSLDPVERWPWAEDSTTAAFEYGGKIQTLVGHPDAPERVVVGIEPAGVYVSNDRGETWIERQYGLHKDVHHILMLSPNEYLTSCGSGLYHTGNAGRSWARLDTDHTYFQYTYIHETALYDGILYTAAAAGAPGTWNGERGIDAVLFESRDSGETFERVPYPGEPKEFVTSWEAINDHVLAGTVAQDLDQEGTTEARILRRDGDGTWTTAGETPAGVTTLTRVL